MWINPNQSKSMQIICVIYNIYIYIYCIDYRFCHHRRFSMNISFLDSSLGLSNHHLSLSYFNHISPYFTNLLHLKLCHPTWSPPKAPYCRQDVAGSKAPDDAGNLLTDVSRHKLRRKFISSDWFPPHHLKGWFSRSIKLASPHKKTVSEFHSWFSRQGRSETPTSCCRKATRFWMAKRSGLMFKKKTVFFLLEFQTSDSPNQAELRNSRMQTLAWKWKLIAWKVSRKYGMSITLLRSST